MLKRLYTVTLMLAALPAFAQTQQQSSQAALAGSLAASLSEALAQVDALKAQVAQLQQAAAKPPQETPKP